MDIGKFITLLMLAVLAVLSIVETLRAGSLEMQNRELLQVLREKQEELDALSRKDSQKTWQHVKK